MASLLLDVHGEVSLDGSLRDEGTHHTTEGLPDGENTGGIHLLLVDPRCLLDQLTEHLRLQIFHIETLLQYLLHLLDGICQAVLAQETVEYLDSLTMSSTVHLLFLSCICKKYDQPNCSISDIIIT